MQLIQINFSRGGYSCDSYLILHHYKLILYLLNNLQQ